MYVILLYRLPNRVILAKEVSRMFDADLITFWKYVVQRKSKKHAFLYVVQRKSKRHAFLYTRRSREI